MHFSSIALAFVLAQTDAPPEPPPPPPPPPVVKPKPGPATPAEAAKKEDGKKEGDKTEETPAGGTPAAPATPETPATPPAGATGDSGGAPADASATDATTTEGAEGAEGSATGVPATDTPATDAPPTEPITVDLPPNPADDALPHLEDAATAVQAGDLQAAEQALTAALEKDPQNLDALQSLAALYMQTDRAMLAIGHLEMALQLDPYNDDARVRLAQAHWAVGQKDPAVARLDELLVRHPQWEEAAALRTQIIDGRSADESPWRPLARANTSFNYDTNVSLQNQDLPTVTNLDAASVIVDVNAGIIYDTPNRPLSVIANASLQTSVASSNSDRDTVERFMASSVGLAATGRMQLGPVLGALDFRWSELFTATFTEHNGRVLNPTLSGSMSLADAHSIALLFGAPMRMPVFNSDDASGGRVATEGDFNASINGTARYGGNFGPVSLTADFGFRHNVNTDITDIGTPNTGFTDVGGALYAVVGLIDALELFAFFDGRGRFFDADGPTAAFSESTFRTQLGARYSLGYFELHAEYGFSANLSDLDSRDYTRHQMGGGVRFWYP